MRYYLYGHSTNFVTIYDYEDMGNSFQFVSPSANYVFSQFTSSIILKTNINAERVVLSIKKMATGKTADTELSGYSVIPGEIASWVLPAVQDIGEILPGETRSANMSGPTGAKGILRVLDVTEGGDFIKVNGCGKDCSSEVDDGGMVAIEASPGADIPEGAYSLTIEATLFCD